MCAELCGAPPGFLLFPLHQARGLGPPCSTAYTRPSVRTVFVAFLRVPACCGSVPHTASPVGCCTPVLGVSSLTRPPVHVFALGLLLSELVHSRETTCLPSAAFPLIGMVRNYSVIISLFRNTPISCQQCAHLGSLTVGDPAYHFFKHCHVSNPRKRVECFLSVC